MQAPPGHFTDKRAKQKGVAYTKRALTIVVTALCISSPVKLLDQSLTDTFSRSLEELKSASKETFKDKLNEMRKTLGDIGKALNQNYLQAKS